MELFEISRSFPKEERYSLVSQMVRASRSVPANIAEGWAKRIHENVFRKHLLDAIGSVDETKTWIDFSKDCGYVSRDIHESLIRRYQETGAKLHNLYENWRTL